MNQSEFESIVDKARQQALLVCHRFGISDDQAEDVAQDTMLRLWTLHDQLDPKQSVEAYSYVVARHLVIDLLRRQHATVPIDTQWDLEDNPHGRPDNTAEARDELHQLDQLLARLPSSEYQVLHLRQTEGLDNQGIARLLGITPQSVATLLSRARKRLLNDMKRRMKR